jgi:hypothetical protein
MAGKIGILRQRSGERRLNNRDARAWSGNNEGRSGTIAAKIAGEAGGSASRDVADAKGRIGEHAGSDADRHGA